MVFKTQVSGGGKWWSQIMHFKNNLTLFAPDFGFLSLVSPHAAQTRWLFYLSEYAYTRQFQVLCYTLPPNSWGEKNIWEELGLNPCPRVPQETARPTRPCNMCNNLTVVSLLRVMFLFQWVTQMNSIMFTVWLLMQVRSWRITEPQWVELEDKKAYALDTFL